MENYHNIVKYGRYFNPAKAHYQNAECVVCDRCHKTDLSICIGYEDYDLCFSCVEEVKRIMDRSKNHMNMTLMAQNQFRQIPLTKMEQHQYTDDNSKLTFMMQDQFRPNIITRMSQRQFTNNNSGYITR